MIYTIYKATNIINKKSYCGFDSNWPKRQREHLSQAFNKKHNAYNTIFHNAIRKHGINSFKWEILYQSLNGKHCLNIMEAYFIKEYNTFYKNNQGYNMSYGGQGSFGRIVSNQTRQKISQNNIGKIISKQHREKISKANTGRKQTPEEKMKHSLATKGKPHSSEWIEKAAEGKRKTYQITFPNGKTILFKGLKKFCRKYKINRKTLTANKGAWKCILIS